MEEWMFFSFFSWQAVRRRKGIRKKKGTFVLKKE
jgi:hypothetical protein